MDLDASTPTPRRRARWHARAALVALVSLVLAGCGIRVQTPPPPPPVPGPVEVVRQGAAETSAALARDAGTGAEATGDEDLFAVLERIRLDSDEHVEALGGVYSEELGAVIDTRTESSEDADAESAAPVAPGDLSSSLVKAAASARAAADGVEDAALAQLLVVIATSRLLGADALARATDSERPDLAAAVPTVVPVGVGVEALASITVAEDQARFAFETIAARSPEGPVRARARESAARHQAASDAWARLAGLTEQGLDPRSVSYALGGGVADAEARKRLAGQVEGALVESYAALVALAEPGSRAELARLHTLAAESARRWGVRPTAFPGLD